MTKKQSSKSKSNKDLTFEKHKRMSWVFIDEGDKQIGVFEWSYQKKKWVFNDFQE